MWSEKVDVKDDDLGKSFAFFMAVKNEKSKKDVLAFSCFLGEEDWNYF